MRSFHRSSILALTLLAGGCATQPQEDADTQSPRHLACAGEVKQMQASCSPDLLRAQGGECSAAANRIVDHCQQ